MEEMVDIVNERNEVVGSAPRKGIHDTDMMHRSVHIFLIDSEGKIWLEKRAKNKDTFPGYYSSSAAGHVSSGESYAEGADREALEELGIDNLKLEQKHMLNASKDTSNEFVAFFIGRSNSTPHKYEEIEEHDLRSVEDIDRMISNGDKFVPIFLELFRWYKANMLS